MATKPKESKPQAGTSRLLKMAEAMEPTTKTWFDRIPPELAVEIREAVQLIADGRTTTNAASLCRAVLADLKAKKEAGQFSGSIPSESSVWSTLRRMVLDCQGKRE